jgi:outer membrane protein assembly factor BamA
VNIEGKTASKQDFLHIFLDPIRGKKTLGQALFDMQVATQRLQSLGLFHTVNLTLEPSENSTDFRVKTIIKDGKRTTVSIGTSMGTDPSDSGTIVSIIISRHNIALGLQSKLQERIWKRRKRFYTSANYIHKEQFHPGSKILRTFSYF